MTADAPQASVTSPVVRRLLAALALAALSASCSTGDGRQLADPDPDLTRVTTTAPTATGEAARGGAAPAFAIPVSSTGPGGLTVSTAAFAPGATIPVEHTCDGDDQPPPIAWSGNGSDRPLALVVRDADADGAVQWLVTGVTGAAGAVDGGGGAAGRARPNSFGVVGWTGPCPADELEHRYVFTLYALSPEVDLPADAPVDDAVRTIEAAHVGASTLVGLYARS